MPSTQLKGKLAAVACGLAVVALSVGLLRTTHPLLNALQNRLEWLTYDLRMGATLSAESEALSRVVIIDIDERSLQSEGRWPWSRSKVAELIDNLFDMGVVVVGTDVVFAEPERNPAERVSTWISATDPEFLSRNASLLNQARQALDGDQRLARSLADREVILGYTFKEKGENQGRLGRPLVIRNPEALQGTPVTTLNAYIGNLPALQDASGTGGFFTVFPDTDGVIRRCPMIVRYDGAIYPSLSLEIARLFLLVDEVEVRTADVGDEPNIEAIVMDGLEIPTDGRGSALVPYLGPAFTFRYIPATDVLNGNIAAGSLENTVALLGSSAKGLFDLRTTPIDPLYPGVEVHANLIAGILDQRFASQPRWADGANLTIVLVVGILLSLVLPFVGAGKLLFITLAMLGSLVGFNLWLWTEHQLVVSITVPFAMVGTLSIFNLAYGYISEARGRSQLKSMFGQYVPPELVDEISRDPKETGFEGDRREMTVLFCDIRSFTTISESLSPAELKDLLNRFFTPMTEIIFKQRGTIDKYVGDMIMAFWGAPVQDPDHAAHGIEAALQMLEKLKDLQVEFETLDLPRVEIGIGLNTGVMNVGNMGSEFRRSYTVLGDSVNLGSRLEGLTKFYGVRLIVGEHTRAGQEGFAFRLLDRVQVKGKAEPVEIFEPVCRIADAGPGLRDELERHHAALASYYAKDWDNAGTAFAALAEEFPETRIYRIYLERMNEMDVASLAEDWNGVFTHTSK